MEQGETSQAYFESLVLRQKKVLRFGVRPFSYEAQVFEHRALRTRVFRGVSVLTECVLRTIKRGIKRCSGRRSRANNGLRRLIREPQTERISCPPPARDGLFKPFRALSFARKSPRPLPCPLLSMFVVKQYRPDGLTSERHKNHN